MPDSQGPKGPPTSEMVQQMVNGMAASGIINQALLTESRELAGEVARFQAENDRLAASLEVQGKVVDRLAAVVRDGTAQERSLISRMTSMEERHRALAQDLAKVVEAKKECQTDRKKEIEGLAGSLKGCQKSCQEKDAALRIARVQAEGQVQAADVKGRWDWKLGLAKALIGLLVAAGGGAATLLLQSWIATKGGP